MSRYVTRTGRVIAPGVVTRASKLLRSRSRKQEKPLPIHLQCHPKALSPTTRNPGCLTNKHGYICTGYDLAYLLTVQQLTKGEGLCAAGRFELSGLKCRNRFTDDPVYAMAFRIAAETTAGLTLEVTE